MKGNVIGFDRDTNTGAISGHDGNRYDFVTADWHSNRQPMRGDVVDFMPADRRATQIYLLEPEYVQPSWGEFLFSFEGRISRSQLWLHWILPVMGLFIVINILMAIAGVDPVASGIVMLILDLIILWPSLATYVKRAHDRARSGWFILLFLVPLLNLWPFIELLFVRGTIGVNRFGPDPVPRT